MIGVLIVSHGRLAEGMKDSIQMIMGEVEQVSTIGLFTDTDLEQFKDEIKNEILKLDTGDGVLVFVDLFGASPANFVASNIQELVGEGTKLRIITGVNLGMLIECMGTRTFETDLDKIYLTSMNAGKDGIHELIDFMSDSDEDDD
ncbi:PTS sugar transporter subunit IIA [Faecalicoccus pleomorphus]|uniref:PTS sugar transporter subunit IIA n=1 Tax=Faecalicoccus pleomorphus TaxID=1323 RepID=UPI00189BF789|nr:PTS sugar transporter subunit IIA [Faecalicoccus pleomorphus]MDB7984242.1 PTS sugar transporter subunit IIA [Faecalicoccus pleomorphus]